MEVSYDHVFASFQAAWIQCCEIAKRHGKTVGSEHQNAGTFYNFICSNHEMKAELTSATRPQAVVKEAEIAEVAVSAHVSGNGIFFGATRRRAVSDIQEQVSELADMQEQVLEVPRQLAESNTHLPELAPNVRQNDSKTEKTARRLQFKDYVVPRVSVKDAWKTGWLPSETTPEPLMNLKLTWLPKNERTALWKVQASLRAIRSALPDSTNITQDNCYSLFVEGFTVLKQRFNLQTTENVSALALYEQYLKKAGVMISRITHHAPRITHHAPRRNPITHHASLRLR
jgi:hypothetical protein